jgi:hypothetical protein
LTRRRKRIRIWAQSRCLFFSVFEHTVGAHMAVMFFILSDDKRATG